MESLEAAGVEGLKKPRSKLLELSPAFPVSSPSAKTSIISAYLIAILLFLLSV
jgi:hypothetical protein